MYRLKWEGVLTHFLWLKFFDLNFFRILKHKNKILFLFIFKIKYFDKISL